MTVLSEKNVVVRTLLNVLDPSTEQLDVCARRQRASLKECRANPGSIAPESRTYLASRPAQIAVLEWLSSSTISVSWSDPCSGRYTEQIWCCGLARVTSRCALTGRAIHHGDRVFRPRMREIRVPANQNQMILAEAVEDPTS
jgi:hypothetical protein